MNMVTMKIRVLMYVSPIMIGMSKTPMAIMDPPNDAAKPKATEVAIGGAAFRNACE